MLNTRDFERALASLQSGLSALAGKEAQRALAGALNEALGVARAAARKAAKGEYTVRRPQALSARIQRAGATSLDARLIFSGPIGLSLIHFKAQPNTPGKAAPITVQIKKKGGRKQVRSPFGAVNPTSVSFRTGTGRAVSFTSHTGRPFILPKKQGGYGIFARTPTGQLEMLFGPSEIQAVGREDIALEISELVSEAFTPILKKRVDAAVERLFARNGR